MADKPSAVPASILVLGLLCLPLCTPLGLLFLGGFVVDVNRRSKK
jgi:hypothetical protein